MSTNRPLQLDLGMPASSPFDMHTGTNRQPTPDGRDQEQLRSEARALQDLVQTGRQTPRAAGPLPAAATSPFDLFGSSAPMEPPASPMPTACPPGDISAGLNDTLATMAQRLLVSDGSSGRRAVQIQLADDNLPGVVMDVFEEEGQLVTSFTCSHEGARERLARNTQWLADGLAERLGRPVSVRVVTDDPEDPCLVEARAGA